MSLRRTVKGAVDRAFRTVDDLLLPVQFNNTKVTGFDFSNSGVESETSQFNTRGLKSSIRGTVGGLPTNIATLIVKTEGIDFSAYTKVTLEGRSYSCKVLEANEFVTTLEIVEVT